MKQRIGLILVIILLIGASFTGFYVDHLLTSSTQGVKLVGLCVANETSSFNYFYHSSSVSTTSTRIAYSTTITTDHSTTFVTSFQSTVTGYFTKEGYGATESYWGANDTVCSYQQFNSSP